MKQGELKQKPTNSTPANGLSQADAPDEVNKIFVSTYRIIQNYVIGKTANEFKQYFTVRKLNEIYNRALGINISWQRLHKLMEYYSKKEVNKK